MAFSDHYCCDGGNYYIPYSKHSYKVKRDYQPYIYSYKRSLQNVGVPLTSAYILLTTQMTLGPFISFWWFN